MVIGIDDAAIAYAASAAIAAGASYYGQQQTNANNTALAQQSMQFGQGNMEYQANYNTHMWERNRDQNNENYYRSLGDQRDSAAIGREFSATMQQGQQDWAAGQANDARAWNWGMTQQQNQYNADQAQRQMDFQREQTNSAQAFNREMSNTSYQRASADMRAAGLNPILAYSQGGATSPTSPAASGASGSGSYPTTSAPSAGGGASSPMASGDTAASAQAGGVSAPGAHTARVENALGPALQSAMQGARFLTEIEQLRANVRRTDAETELLNTQAPQSRAITAREVQAAATAGASESLIRAQTGNEEGPRRSLLGAQAGEAQASAARHAAAERLTREETDQMQRYGRPGRLGDIASTVGTVGGNVARPAAEAYSGVVRDAARSTIRGGAAASGAVGNAIGNIGAWINRQLQNAHSPAGERLRRAHEQIR